MDGFSQGSPSIELGSINIFFDGSIILAMFYPLNSDIQSQKASRAVQMAILRMGSKSRDATATSNVDLDPCLIELYTV